MNIELLEGDCTFEHKAIKDGSVDLILTDLPYGTVTNIASSDTVKHGMQNKTNWDCVIETENISIRIVGSGNWTRNDKIEIYSISSNPILCEFNKNFIKNEIEKPE